MRGTNNNANGDKSAAENDQALRSRCVSALHAIPGFDRVSHRKLYPKGSVLFAEGQAARGVYVLCSGRAKLSLISAEGKVLIVRIARPGDLLGIHATLAGHSYEATAETLAPCRVDFISRKDLLILLERQKSSGLGLAIAISKDFTEFVEHARVLLLSVSAAEKLARLLLRLGDEFGERTSTGVHLQTLLTHEEIAQMIAASRETVTRVLSEFRRKHIIGLTDHGILVRNRKGLESVARY
ncbi:MAG: Crp/Fnr family transcriptional regulator [Acidobacteriota bacterium]